MPTGIITNDKTFNVLATKGICPSRTFEYRYDYY